MPLSNLFLSRDFVTGKLNGYNYKTEFFQKLILSSLKITRSQNYRCHTNVHVVGIDLTTDTGFMLIYRDFASESP